MQEVSARNFGILIAYLLPGFVTLWGASLVSPAVRVWLTGSASCGPSVSGFLYVSIASVGAGMTVSAVRWAVVDRLHQVTGLHRPEWDDSWLTECLPAFEALVENHYRYYQFYANMLVALALAYPAWRIVTPTGPFSWTDLGFLLVEGVFLAPSRDVLGRYYRRSAILLGTRERQVKHDQRSRLRRRCRRTAAGQTVHEGSESDSGKPSVGPETTAPAGPETGDSELTRSRKPKAVGRGNLTAWRPGEIAGNKPQYKVIPSRTSGAPRVAVRRGVAPAAQVHYGFCPTKIASERSQRQFAA